MPYAANKSYVGYRWNPLKNRKFTLLGAGWCCIPDRGLKEVNDLFVLLIVGVASHIECGRTRSVLGELPKIQPSGIRLMVWCGSHLVRPYVSVWSTLVDPIFVH